MHRTKVGQSTDDGREFYVLGVDHWKIHSLHPEEVDVLEGHEEYLESYDSIDAGRFIDLIRKG